MSPDCSGLKMQRELFSRWWAISLPCPTHSVLSCPAGCQPVLCCPRHGLCYPLCSEKSSNITPSFHIARASLPGPYKSYLSTLLIVFVAPKYYQTLSYLLPLSRQGGSIPVSSLLLFPGPRIMLGAQQAVHNYLLNE